ncbi:UDP-glycosyltransferase [Flavobacterium sp. GA093]|uniref:UDP-glycosyltransferase n=1 Tax=Flavobacterium hydrocarbonoxydans TaxID=2683249 RepID=A0A6I4NJE7_9FLAO|nr:UDP-glycosyltransferase [Flavobacterium hydrocarbonoxydans]MWB94518.1 UDP-glycosyltransferase [Flavobacterium hydrocarbonoxydans]
MKKKIFVFLPDGVGLRNFALTAFKNIGENRDFDIIYWNNTPFSITEKLGFKEIKIQDTTLHPFTTVYTRARKRMELNFYDKKFKETVYNTYNFPHSYFGIKNVFKSVMVDTLTFFGSNTKGIQFVRERIKKAERTTTKYQHCKKQLQEHKPDFVFCTNQRPTQAISPILAAQDLGIPTGTFIFSWDNLPKAMTLVETDYYFVWSQHMKKELLTYSPYVDESQVFVTGTPQFESHFDKSLLQTKETFFENHRLDINTKYICFSGDDIVTSPLDQFYLEDLAISVRELNNQGYSLGIIYRKCPVDFTDRYESVLKKYKDVIVSIDPLWTPVGTSWNEIMPTKEDFALQANVCEHTEFVANIASSMVFDFVAHNKSCLFFDYEQPQLKKGIRDIGQNYKYIHFRSMPTNEAALWIKDKTMLTQKVKDILDGKASSVADGKKWFEIIVGERPIDASQKIWDSIDFILK